MATFSTRSSLITTAEVAGRPLLAVLAGPRDAVVHLQGEVDGAATAEIAGRARALAREGRTELTLDLERVTHWDYRSLRTVARLAESLRLQGGGLRLTAPNTYLRTILRFSGLEPLVAERPGASAPRTAPTPPSLPWMRR